MIASRPPSIRVLFGTLLMLVMLLAAGLFSVTILQRRTATQRTDAERQRVTSFHLSDQMRQSSNDLTRMVRLYVTTGDSRYRRYYDEILAIRRGVAPRPRNYDSSYWDRVLGADHAARLSGPPTSLTELMRRAHFSAAEFTALNASLRASDQLAQLEERVMNAVSPRIAAGVGRSYLGDVEPHYRLLVDARYHREKRRIMNAIERFTRLVDGRTSARSAALRARTQKLLVSQTGDPRAARARAARDARARRPHDRTTARAPDRGHAADRRRRLVAARPRGGRRGAARARRRLQRDGRRRRARPRRSAACRVRRARGLRAPAHDRRPRSRSGLPLPRRRQRWPVGALRQPRRQRPRRRRQRGGRLPVGRARGRCRRPRRVAGLDGRRGARGRAVAPRVPHPHDDR